MSTKSLTPATRAFSQLLNLAHANGAMPANSLQFALAWLAAPTLASAQRLEGVGRLQDFLLPATWRALAAYLGESEQSFPLGYVHSKSVESIYAEALSIVSGLVSEHGVKGWELMDAAWIYSGQSRSSDYGFWAFDPELCDLAVSRLGARSGDEVWIPFDRVGQLTIRAIRTGAKVIVSYEKGQSQALVRLLLEIEDNPQARERITFCEADQIADKLPSGGPSHCLVAAPIGVRVDQIRVRSELEQVSTCRQLPVAPSDFNRSDPWAVATIWPTVRECGVFLVPPSLLFGLGQELRLRQALMFGRDGNQVSQVYALPTGLLSNTNLATSLLVLHAHTDPLSVRMIDVAGQTIDGQQRYRFGRDIDVAKIESIFEHDETLPAIDVTVTTRECADADYSLMPSRYTRRATHLAGERRPLGELLAADVLRSPVSSKDSFATSIWEAGIPLLDRWRPIEGGYEKWMRIPPRRVADFQLQADDIVISVKGTLGKVGIIGHGQTASNPEPQDLNVIGGEGDDRIPKGSACVPSSSCIALRVNSSKILPKFLLLYLRSDDFKRQLEALRVGAVIAHITPASLLSGIMVPVPSLAEQAKMVEQYEELKRLEEEVEEIQTRMREIHAGLF